MAISCNQCNMLAINGVPCHETGCPNERKTWDSENEVWVKMYTCIECGSEYEDEDEAYNCCNPEHWDDHEEDDDLWDDPDRLEAGIQGVAPFFDVDPITED